MFNRLSLYSVHRVRMELTIADVITVLCLLKYFLVELNVSMHVVKVDVTSYGCVSITCSLVRPSNLDQLVNFILQSPADDENEKTKYKLVCITFGVFA